MTNRLSPLDAEHRRLGAKITPFGGWEMPLNYAEGTIAEHLSCRQDAVVFDVSHLGTVRVSGPDAHRRLQETLTNDLDKIRPGRAQYTHLLDDADGSVLDDIIVWWRPDGETFDVMPNASNTDRVVAAVGGSDITAERAVVAVQGPKFADHLALVMPEAVSVGRNDVVVLDWRGIPCTVAGTGYTGERGVEISIPSASAAELWRALLDTGIAPAGLGARDTLRLEAGLPLHGHELGAGITPLQAGLEWVVAWKKPTFRGRRALEIEKEKGPSRRLRGIATEGRRPPRADCPVRLDGVEIGSITSGNFSPILGHGIALAFLSPDVEQGSCVSVDLRGTELSGQVVPLPFVSKG